MRNSAECDAKEVPEVTKSDIMTGRGWGSCEWMARGQGYWEWMVLLV